MNNEDTNEKDAATLGPPEEGPQNHAPDASAEPGPPKDGPHSSPRKTSSPRKVAANRENSKHSTGPKTAEGKAKSARNSITHGIFARQLLTGATPETAAEISTLTAGIWEFYQPAGVIEELLVQKIAVEVVRLTRIMGFERKEFSRQSIFHFPVVDRLLRYSAAADRGLYRAIEELERLQTARKARAESEDTADEDPAPAAGEDDAPPSDQED